MELDSPDDPDSTSSLLGTPQPKPALPDDDEDDDMQISPNAISSQTITVVNPDHSIVSLQTQTLHPKSSSPSTKSILPYPTDNNTSEALKGVYRKSVYNPFVSAGFVTEFTGDGRATTGQAKGLGIIKNSPPNFPGAAKTSFDVEPTSTPPPAGTNPLVQEEEHTNDSLLKENPRSSGDFKNKEAKPASIPTGPRNAVASSSKVLLEHAKPMSNASRASRSLRNPVDEPVPNRNSQAVLSSGPYNNPLGIKPSRPITPTLAPAPVGSKTLAMADANSHPPPFCPQSMPKTSNLVAYSSPSPPVAPTPAPPPYSPKHPPSPVQTKWKRLPSIDTTSSTVSAKGSRAPNPHPANETFVPFLPSLLDSSKKSPNFATPKRNQTNGHSFDILLEPQRSPVIPQPPTSTLLDPMPPTPTSLPSAQTIDNGRFNAPSHAQPSPITSNPSNDSATRTNSPTLFIPWNAATAINPVKLPALSGTFPVDLSSIPQTFHPLPQKPLVVAVSRGVKRERAPSPNANEFLDSMQEHKRTFRWPTLQSNHSTLLRGEGDLTILGIAGTVDGTLLALNCADKTIRIWNNNTRTEMARLSHNARVASVLWLDDDSGIISLGEDGMISRWNRTSFNHWTWAKMVDIDRVAVSLPTVGVKLWVWSKGAGSWQAQQPILRPNVTALTFIEGGSTLLGGTVDGVLWACEVPNGIIRACAFLKTKIFSIDVNSAKTHALIACHGVSRLIGLQAEKRGKLEQSYANKDTESSPHQLHTFACFTAREGYASVWIGPCFGRGRSWTRYDGGFFSR
ncbi:hypothetical protein F5050DRAFT_1180509 [Lentinula boryana]|uniref:WD40 repeat-like protein n=1 Tax=Lentinula boryana TaxID=40481 RepID=A0ABQ8QJ56_9AGAR|nr:hypothetical protein F5050DRAFT_1180509 [Lentinula boryana]